MSSAPVADPVLVSAVALRRFCQAALAHRSVRADVADHVAASVVQTSLRGVDSHGFELIPHYLRALDAGRINPDPRYGFEQTAASTGTLDGDHTFGHAAGAEGMRHAMGLARATGLGAVAVRNSSHFGAAAYFALMAASDELIGFSFTHADSLMLSFGGTRPFFGTNPICMAAPVEGEEPFCLDMATTLVSWNKVRRFQARGDRLPDGWACDGDGNPVTNPEAARALLPIGDYKGFGLGMMVEILCGLLTGMPFGREISRMYADPLPQKRHLGHFFIALDAERFVGLGMFERRLREMMDALRHEPARGEGVLVPGDPEKACARVRERDGVPVTAETWAQCRAFGEQMGFDWDVR
jgi:ureidoglycolate dehydrogenase (NAD+)